MKGFKIAAVLAVLIVAACSDDDDNNEASAEFTGDDCVYSGPTEFKFGDEFEITVSDVTEERMDVGFAVHPVPDDEDDDHGEFLFSEVTEEGTERVLSATLDVAGTWQVECFFFNPDGAFAATTFDVVEES
jgi:hypothetical protein